MVDWIGIQGAVYCGYLSNVIDNGLHKKLESHVQIPIRFVTFPYMQLSLHDNESKRDMSTQVCHICLYQHVTVFVWKQIQWLWVVFEPDMPIPISMLKSSTLQSPLPSFPVRDAYYSYPWIPEISKMNACKFYSFSPTYQSLIWEAKHYNFFGLMTF